MVHLFFACNEGKKHYMSLKIPGIGKKIDEYTYCIGADNQGGICIHIKFEICNTYGKPVLKRKTFEIQTDDRHSDTRHSIDLLTELLEKGLNGATVKITEDKDRAYLYFDKYQFTGCMLNGA